MQVIPVRCLKDNYAYVVYDENSSRAIVIDPSEATPVLAVLAQYNLELEAIWNTHHHWDHVGGNEDIRTHIGAHVPVVAHESDRGRVPGQTVFLRDGDEIEGGGIRATVLHIPGHTLGAIAYCTDESVFTGDTLFVGGCGRLFQGTAEMMFSSLRRLSDLKDDCALYSGHEYATSNLRFGLFLEPENLHMREMKSQISNTFTKSTLGNEKNINPFLRCHLDTYREKYPNDTPVQIFAKLRELKNTF